MRIIAGTHKGRRLAAPAGARPTSDRARTVLFDVLAHNALGPGGAPSIEDAVVLDVFAGSGAFGLEALSRGAARALFLEKDRAALAAIETNIKTLGEAARAKALRADALRPPRAETAASLAFLDPPYGEDLGAPALTALSAQGWLVSGTLAILEISKRDDFATPPGFTEIERREVGETRFVLLRRN